MVYQGGDDCLALKPNSSMITARNVTCYGGTGIAFGSIGQYKGQVDYIQDVYVEDITISGGQHEAQNGLYFKSWQGIADGTPPNGGGGGIGFAQNITARNIRVNEVTRPLFLHSE
jgi:galacturan 1,4-alpha-galacturonidase